VGYAAANTLSGSRLDTPLSVTTKQSLADTAATSPVVTSDSVPALGKIAARRNLNETAFFLPHLRTDRQGRVTMTFTMPEALTEWKLLGFAHDKRLRSGFLSGKTVTAKDLMVEPNPPRFVREGDVVEFTVKVTNQSEREQRGTVRLNFADAETLQPVDVALGNRVPEQSFVVPARESRSFAWRIAVPDGMGFLTYKAVGATAEASDGEENFLPVLSRRILVTESLALPIRGKGTKQFEFGKLIDAGRSDTLRHQSLTVQMVSQPAWYAVMALPYLMEYPHECSEQIFNRLYANALARHVANAQPKIRAVFERWKNTSALESPLEKNGDLKSVLLEETPWLRQAKSESEARRNVGVLFDAARLDAESARALQALAERQLSDGLWPWFPGSPPNEFISLYIVTGFGRLRHLGATVDTAPAVKALRALDVWMEERCQRIGNRDLYVPSSLDALYLYGRSFFLADQPVAESQRETVEFLLRQTRKYWLQVDCRQSQAHLALALQRFGDAQTARRIVESFKERSVTDPELGMFWRDLELSWWWYRAPIETQALMIEAFAEIANDAAAVEDCKVWLLKQKQTQDWKTTKATADAVYALLLRGENLLASDALVAVALGGEPIAPESSEAGTGFYEQRFAKGKITPEMGRIAVKKTDDGVSWGSVHWQYFESIDRLTPHTDTPLTLRKTLFVKETTSRGSVLKPVTGPIAVGDELIVRLELRTDRDMEYLHLKDQRGSGTEPVNVLSRYRRQDGLAYYESTRDTASHFFIDYLPKGTYVFEYSTRVQLKGRYQTGIAEIQCMYAPEFNSHSESFALEVR
ncbi:MAG: alpha-2-macroglobulin family protein, partial [Opitutaceae bacterium]